MAKKTWKEKFNNGRQPEVCELDDAQAGRLKGRTLLVPIPAQVDAEIRKIPHGQTKTMKEIGDELAKAHNADISCPMCMGIYWRIVAECAEEDRAEVKTDITPYWRVTANGKPNPKLPGGAEHHKALIDSEKA